MKTEKYYFYLEKTTIKDHEEFFTVIEVQSFNDDVDEADRKARTITIRMKEKLAGGYFSEKCKPYDFKTNYTVIKCPDNTKVDPYNAQDLFIMDLIEKECSCEYTIL